MGWIWRKTIQATHSVIAMIRIIQNRDKKMMISKSRPKLKPRGWRKRRRKDKKKKKIET